MKQTEAERFYKLAVTDYKQSQSKVGTEKKKLLEEAKKNVTNVYIQADATDDIKDKAEKLEMVIDSDLNKLK